MKKVLSILLSIALVFTIMAPYKAYAKADQKVKLEDAIGTAKKALDISTENYNFNYNYSENPEGRSTWDLNWNSKKSTGGGMYVSIDAETGDIINFNMWVPYDNTSVSKIPKYSKEQALKAAIEFAKKLQPEKFNEMVQRNESTPYYDMPIYSDAYNFSFSRKVNGLDYLENGINIAIDKNTLKVKNYSFNWDKGPFTDPSKTIEPDEAQKVFENKLGIQLSYNLIYDQKTKQPQPILVYSLSNGNNSIDAVTGDVLTNGWFPSYGYASEAKAATADKPASVPMTPEEQKSVDTSGKYVSKDKALEEAKKYVSINDNAKLNFSNLYVDSMSQNASWNFTWDSSDPVKKTYNYVSAQVDAVTGKIKSFNMSGIDFYPEKDTPVTYTKDQAKELAEKFISQVEPEKFKLTKYKEVINPYAPKDAKVTDYSFSYVASINNAECNFDFFNITVNAYSGKVMNYNMNWQDVTLPPSDGAMNSSDAYKTFYSKAKLELRYVKFYNYSESKGNVPEIKLAYVVTSPSQFFDAKSGLFLDGAGQPIKEKKVISYSDIKGNDYENDINILVDLGVIDSQSDKFMPNDNILQKDFIKILMRSIQPTYVIYNIDASGTNEEYDSYYDQAIQRKIITEADKHPDSVVTRKDAAKLILRAIGVGFVAGLDNIYNLQFNDSKSIPDGYKGYAAISSELKIIPSDNGSFNADKNVTRGQAASFIVNFLKVDPTSN